MNDPVLFAVISMQVLAFQFLSLRLTRSLPDYLVGCDGLPGPTAIEVEQFKQRTGRLRRAIGVALWAAAVLLFFWPSIDAGVSKLGLAAVSLISSAVFTVGFFHDRRAVRRISAVLPEPALRTATLRLRTLSRHYPIVWEGLPIVIAAATAGVTLWAASSPSISTRWELLIYPVVQGLVVFGGLLWAVFAARSVQELPQRVRPFVGGGAAAAEASETLGTIEMRFFLAARSGLALMFGLAQVVQLLVVPRRGLPGIVTERHAPAWLDWSYWGVLVLLLALFAAYGFTVPGVRRRLGHPEAR